MKNLTELNEVSVLTDKETLEEVVNCLSQHISIETKGAFNQTDLFNILVRAASQSDKERKYGFYFKASPWGE